MARTKGKLPELDGRGFLAEMRDLKLSYRETYWRLRSALRAAEAVKKDVDGNPTEHPDVGTLRSAISDVNFAIQWMHTGKRPGSKRGIERRSAYQREKLIDPIIMQSYANPTNSRSASSLSEEEKWMLREALEILSDQERECFVMAFGHGISHEQIADMLGIARGTIGSYIKRAHEKVSRGWQGTLF